MSRTTTNEPVYKEETEKEKKKRKKSKAVLNDLNACLKNDPLFKRVVEEGVVHNGIEDSQKMVYALEDAMGEE